MSSLGARECFQTGAFFLLCKTVLVDAKSDGVIEESGLSKEDILKIYFNQNRRARREEVKSEGNKG